MVRPIFIVKIPKSKKDDTVILNGLTNMEKELYDYHVLCIFHDSNDFAFEAFYPNDFDEIKIEEFKQKLNDRLIN
jgi:hypothetical protein